MSFHCVRKRECADQMVLTNKQSVIAQADSACVWKCHNVAALAPSLQLLDCRSSSSSSHLRLKEVAAAVSQLKCLEYTWAGTAQSCCVWYCSHLWAPTNASDPSRWGITVCRFARHWNPTFVCNVFESSMRLLWKHRRSSSPLSACSITPPNSLWHVILTGWKGLPGPVLQSKSLSFWSSSLIETFQGGDLPPSGVNCFEGKSRVYSFSTICCSQHVLWLT